MNVGEIAHRLVTVWGRFSPPEKALSVLGVPGMVYLPVFSLLWRSDAIPAWLALSSTSGIAIGAVLVVSGAIFGFRIAVRSAQPESKLRVPASPPRPVIHVLLPLSSALGDGLLQGAGFLAAQTVYKDIELKFFDHKNDAASAAAHVRTLMQTWTRKDFPLRIIVTMSAVADEVMRAVREELSDRPDLKKQFTLVLTVASAPSITADPEIGIFRHFINGSREAEAIYRCVSTIRDGTAGPPPILLLTLNTKYPLETMAEVAGHLARDNRYFVNVPCAATGEWLRAMGDARELVLADPRQIAVTVGYDIGLFSTLQALQDAGFKGKLVASATLSVPDWQQYLRSEGIISADGFRSFCVNIKGTPGQDGSARFVKALEQWNFETVTASEQLYQISAGKMIRSQFSDVEKKAYNSIEPNYISAFCFDCVRLFDISIRAGARRFSKDIQKDFAKTNDPGPLGGLSPDYANNAEVPKLEVVPVQFAV